MGTAGGQARNLGALAARFGLDLIAGSPAGRITGVCALTPGRAGCIAFAERAQQADAVTRSRAAAVIVPAALAAYCPAGALVSAQPKLAFARLAALFTAPAPAPGRHPSAIVDASAEVDATAWLGAHVAVGANSMIEAGAVIAPGCVIGAHARIGRDTRIASHVSIGANVVVGARTSIEAHAVLGARGFGLVHNGQAWEAMPQLAGVSIGADVEIGAGTTIDRGTFEDTVVEAGVKIDDQVHIGHNCVIGAHTVIAGCTGIAGSATIGANCMIGGGVGIGDHVRIAAGAVITAASQVPKDIGASGVYSSTFRAMPARIWRNRLALFRRFDRIERRLKAVERSHPKAENDP